MDDPGVTLMPTKHSNLRPRGRFAPSPTGPLHFGSLVAAVGSYLDAKSGGGEWLVRIEDVDTPRVVAGASDDILRTLEAFGLYWDGAVMYQSRRGGAYRAALDEIDQLGRLYSCSCSRKEISDSALATPAGLIYPGSCRRGVKHIRSEYALRVKTDDKAIAFHDRLQGKHVQSLESAVGDFVLRRADSVYAYQLAVVVDDAEQGITDVVRGADMLDSTLRQIYLQRLLGLATPTYLHLPIALNKYGEKLSKQTLAPAVAVATALPLARRALCFLGHEVPSDMLEAGLADLWEWAIAQWSPAKVPACRSRVGD